MVHDCAHGCDEKGHGARWMDNEWARSLVNQCADAGVPILIKQLSAENGKVLGDLADFPEDLRVRQYPGEQA